ncbi:MAG TPA: hypothetical protein VGK18_07985 [Propionicimonas sp.]|uniref:hypothetical protein n=1 Tax=Propionicimonas sp. TaxID=1955623 RepID=UPI002F415913
MRQIISIAATAALLSGFALLPATPAVAAPVPPCASGTPLPGDYDGDGGADLLVGFLDAGSITGTHVNASHLVTPSDGGTAYRLDVPDGQSFPVVDADLNGDLCSDVILVTAYKVLVVLGAPGGLAMAAAKTLPLPEPAESGSLGLFYAAAGLRHDGISQIVVAGTRDYDHSLDHPALETILETFTLDAAGSPGTPVLTDLVPYGVGQRVRLAGSGASVAVGAPYAKVAKKTNAGAVVMLTANPAGALTYRTTITQNSPRVPGAAETNDAFGESVSLRDGRLAIGAPTERLGKASETGLVQPIRWHEDTATYTAYRSINQDTRGVAGSNKTGDAFGWVVLVTRGLTAAGSYDIAIGTPFKKVGHATTAGSVTVANFTRASYRTYTQNTRGVPGTAETNDWFGGTLGVLRTSPTVDTLLIGAPSETSGAAQPGYVIRSNGKRLASSVWRSVAAPAGYRLWGRNFAS